MLGVRGGSLKAGHYTCSNGKRSLASRSLNKLLQL